MASSDDAPIAAFASVLVGGGSQSGGGGEVRDAWRPMLVAIVADPSGRWQSVMAGNSPEAVGTRQLLCQVAGIVRADEFHVGSCANAKLLGFAVLGGGRSDQTRTCSQQSWALIQAVEAHMKRHSRLCYLEHPALAVAEALRQEIPLPSLWRYQPMQSLGNYMFQCALRMDVAVRVTKASRCQDIGQVRLLANVMQEWAFEFGFDSRQCIARRLCAPIAEALIRGRWFGDLSVISHGLEPDEILPRLTRRELMALRKAKAVMLPPLAPRVELPGKRKGSVWSHPAPRLIRALRASRHYKSQATFEEGVRDAVVYYMDDPNLADAAIGDMPGECAPSRRTLERGRVKLDIASMLYHREWYSKAWPTFRFLAFDASPQRPGVEIFATVERIVKRQCCANMTNATTRPDVLVRRLPIACLGQGKFSLADKVQAHLHQVRLDYGPEPSRVRAANADVRQCLTDMGVELSIVDVPDRVEQALGHLSLSQTASGYMYPYALAVPGIQHILDGVLRETVEAFSWWPSWQSEAKGVCQWLHSLGHRQQLDAILRGAVVDDIERKSKSLKKSINKFAQWRWKTLYQVASGLVAKESAVRAAVSLVRDSAELSSRDAAKVNGFLSATRSALFWDRARMLLALVRPLMDFSSWVRGCDCHEAELKAGKTVRCNWKGCRAGALHQRVRIFEAEVIALRAQARAHLCVGVDSTEWIAALTRMLARAMLKFSWVNELPYLVWQATPGSKLRV